MIWFHYIKSEWLNFFFTESFCSRNNGRLQSRACLGVRHISCQRNEKNAMESHVLIFESCFPDFCVLPPTLEINITGGTHCKSTVIYCKFSYLVLCEYWLWFNITSFHWGFLARRWKCGSTGTSPDSVVVPLKSRNSARWKSCYCL